jgi:hypothetical protein
MKTLIKILPLLLLFQCNSNTPTKEAATNYYDLNEIGVKMGGVKMIPIHGGKYNV